MIQDIKYFRDYKTSFKMNWGNWENSLTIAEEFANHITFEQRLIFDELKSKEGIS